MLAAGLRMFGRDEVRDLLARYGFTDIDRHIEGVTQTVVATRTRQPADVLGGDSP